MRVAVLTDAHADAGALESVFTAFEREGIDRCWCLGDFCSGGPEPRQCFDLVTEKCECILLGNHEIFVIMRIWGSTQGGFAGAARFAFQELGERRYAELLDYSSHALTPEAELVHGSLLAPTDDFLLGARSAQRNLELLNRPLLLFGHTHEPIMWEPHKSGRWAKDTKPTLEIAYELPDDLSHPYHERLLNPGAVCDAHGARWLELNFSDGGRFATWHQTDTPGHGGIFSYHP